jgi:hypothetical protein
VRVTVTGATGFVGVPLVKALIARGDAVTVLTRSASRAPAGTTAIEADIETPGEWSKTALACDAVIHLAGESVAGKRWDARQKQVIRDSRIESTRVIVEEIGKLPAGERPKVLITASGVDYYPYADPSFDDTDEVTERDPASDTFLGRVCRDWEGEAAVVDKLGVRGVRLRIGLVIGPGGGPLASMTTPFKLFAGGKLGSGRQWVSWIHLDDLLAMILAATGDDRYRGPLNAVAPDSVRNRDLATAIGHALHRPSLFPAPGFALRLALGEFAEVVLHGRRVVPAALKKLGFTWKHPDLDEALKSAL